MIKTKSDATYINWFDHLNSCTRCKYQPGFCQAGRKLVSQCWETDLGLMLLAALK